MKFLMDTRLPELLLLQFVYLNLTSYYTNETYYSTVVYSFRLISLVRFIILYIIIYYIKYIIILLY